MNDSYCIGHSLKKISKQGLKNCFSLSGLEVNMLVIYPIISSLNPFKVLEKLFLRNAIREEIN